jgi:hypothetical protein
MVHQLGFFSPVPLWLMAMVDEATFYKDGMIPQVGSFY